MLYFLMCAALVGGTAHSQESSQDKPVTQKNEAAKQNHADTKRAASSKAQNKSAPVNRTRKKGNEHTDDKLAVDRQIRDYTGQLADYTKQLAVYTRDVARFTQALVWATMVLGILGIGTAILAVKEFVTANRPKLVARRFQLIIPEKGDRPIVEFMLANVGGTTAVIEMDNVSAKILEHTDMEKFEQRSFPEYQGQINILKATKRKYRPTKRMAQNVHFVGIEDPVSAFKRIKDSTVQFVCYGFIRYRDPMWGRYETVFYRKYRKGERFLVPSDDPDYDDNPNQR
jgi:hypothetical protein